MNNPPNHFSTDASEQVPSLCFGEISIRSVMEMKLKYTQHGHKKRRLEGEAQCNFTVTRQGEFSTALTVTYSRKSNRSWVITARSIHDLFLALTPLNKIFSFSKSPFSDCGHIFVCKCSDPTTLHKSHILQRTLHQPFFSCVKINFALFDHLN